MRNLYITLCLTLIGFPVLGQQDGLISNYQFNQISINPGYTGVNDITSFDLQFRKQWSGVDNSPTTTLLSGQTSLKENRLGLGFSLIHDQAGIIKNTEINLSYAYELDVGTSTTLSFGIHTGLLNLNYDFGALNIDDPSDPDFLNAEDGLSKFNLGAGLFLSSKNYYIGLSAPKLLNATEDIDDVGDGSRYNRHFYATGGYIFELVSNNISIKPYTVLRFAQDTPMSADVGVSGLFAQVLWAGLFTRDFDTFGIALNLNLRNGLRVGYTGELASDSVDESSFSTHEISLGIDLALLEMQSVVNRLF